MAVCTKCKGEMGQTAAVCPHCGYEFTEPPGPRPVPWWIYLGLAAAWVAFLVLFEHTLLWKIVSGLVALALAVSLFLGAWRFLRGE
jgi:hypothetical protein